MSSGQVKLTTDDEMVELAKWHNLVESDEYRQTVLAKLDKTLDDLQREKLSLSKKFSGMDHLIASGQCDSQIVLIGELKKFFEMKSRKYQRKIKGE